jgi:uncharacterized protein with GYD domain
MATYLSTLKLTRQGLQSIGETTKRAAALKASAKKMGVKIVNSYWTLGTYDGLLIFEADDDETATALMLQVAASGNVHTSTTRAFTAAEMDRILEKIGD